MLREIEHVLSKRERRQEKSIPCPTMKLFIQFDDAPKAIPYGLFDSGQISATIIQAHGPQLYPKLTTNNHTIQIAAHPDAFDRPADQASPERANRMAMMMWQVAMPMAPMVKTGFRPKRSMYKTEGMVARNMTMPTTPVASRETALEESPSSVNMVGA